MSLPFFADQCVPAFVLNALREYGHKVIPLSQHLDVESPDSKVIQKAQELNCILISLNGDFSDIVSYPPANYKGIIALQCRNHPETLPQLIIRLQSYLESHKDMDQYKGKLIIVEAHRIRLRF